MSLIDSKAVAMAKAAAGSASIESATPEQNLAKEKQESNWTQYVREVRRKLNLKSLTRWWARFRFLNFDCNTREFFSACT